MVRPEPLAGMVDVRVVTSILECVPNELSAERLQPGHSVLVLRFCSM